MKFEFLFEDVNSDKNMDESKFANPDNFFVWTEKAVATIRDVCENDPLKIKTLPGIASYKVYVSDIPDVNNEDWVDIIFSLEKYYVSWLNSMDPKKSAEIYRATKKWIKENKRPGIKGPKPGSKNKPKDNAVKTTQGLDYSPVGTQTRVEPNVSIEKKKPGRPALPPGMKKTYIPTGNPRGPKPGSKKTPIDTSDVTKVALSNKPNTEPTMADFMNQMKAMQAQIERLKKRLGDNPTNDEDKIYESKNKMKNQYQRFL
jgi:hypothetical protein